ncbi:putative ABC transporter permease [Arabiibacter massiliensis]|uniref:putative ABC transporter permease n=1 Tax=Arabiibacter massiliensis TaxID=1870985 RepID=UPI0009B9EEB3|nr:putative ABC transporter permease [Arabiibacter massiliensis]
MGALDTVRFAPSWKRWRSLAIVFCVFSVAGHWVEVGYCQLVRLGVVPGVYDPASPILSDWLSPYCVYGVGAMVCVLALTPAKDLLLRAFRGRAMPLVLSFALNALVCAGLEFAMGLAFNQPLRGDALPLWDYRGMPCKFLGQVCLQNVVAFGLVATFMTWIVCPRLETLFRRASNHAMDDAFAAVASGFAALLMLGGRTISRAS